MSCKIWGMHLLKYAEIFFSGIVFVAGLSEICNCDIKSFEQLDMNINPLKTKRICFI
jgi:hypothetical protein